jgi:hypothetical protein
MRGAIVENGVVVAVWAVDRLDQFPGMIDGTHADVGDLWDGVSFSKPPRDLAKEKAALIERIKAKRIKVAESGIDVGGKLIPSDKEALVLFTSSLDYLADKPGKTIKRAGLGELTKAQIKDLFEAVGALHDFAFSRESDLFDLIMAASTGAELDAIDIESGWTP